ncbi:hypothetical protein KZZ52_26315 [Dactylosporangium sp. AC04546]|uniref:hypothetical protein n=1 Tax=Dactylosporangium sp. AC04546 TaxID=2862460 RepID=UPI001EDD8007|nr:hypothetical protein [Dactylosporangium sp. AC04546]WVK88786.1 hypothetical protein KZZ52_26315 [Dactylosporangium sp. AC04546]
MIRWRTYSAPGGQRTVEPGALAEVYAAADPDGRPVFYHGDDLVVWIVDGEHCHVELRAGDGWYDLVEPGVPGEADVVLANIPGTVPRASVLPRERGLEVLRTADDRVRLRTLHSWQPVPWWVVDRGGYLVRDVVEAMHDRAGELHMRIRFAGESGDSEPVGLRHLSYLVGFDADTMGDGLDWVVGEHTTAQLEAAGAAASYLGLTEIAELIGRLTASGQDYELAQALNPVYWRLCDADGTDAIRDAVRRRIAEAPAEWGLT